MPGILALAFGDVHSPEYIAKFREGLQNFRGESFDIVLSAGDLIDRGRVPALKYVLDAVQKYIDYRVFVSCFGNEEYDSVKERLISEYPEIVWIDDNAAEIHVNGESLIVIGSRGVLDKPTQWQERNIPNIERIYFERLSKLASLLRKYSTSRSIVVLLTHYAVTYKTLVGEDRRIWPQLGSRRMEDVLRRYKPDIAIHAHAHKSRVTEATIDSVKVYNVSLPANSWRPKVIRLERTRKTILDFFG